LTSVAVAAGQHHLQVRRTAQRPHPGDAGADESGMFFPLPRQLRDRATA
jgi:hypothetical protein